MNSKSDVSSNNPEKDRNIDVLKWVMAAFLLSVGFFGYHHFSEYPTVYRALALVPVVILVFFIVALTVQGAIFLNLLREAVVETRRVVWPTRQETVQTTLVVIGFVFVMSFILWGLDAVFGKLISLMIG